MTRLVTDVWTPLTHLLLVLTLAVGLAGIVLYWATGGLSSNDPMVRLEIIKSALQVLVVAVIANPLTLLVQAVQKGRDRRASERELRTNFLGRAVKSYAAAKKIRRQLRTGTDARTFFEDLNDVQLDFESMKREVQHAPVFERGAAIADALECMEKYLNHLIEECEKAPQAALRHPFSTGHNVASLADFTGRDRGSCFHTQFVHAFDVLLALMQAEILDRPPKIPEPKPGQLRCQAGWFRPKPPLA